MNRLFIWGTGEIAKCIYSNLLDKDVVTAFVETNVKNDIFDGKSVIVPENIVMDTNDVLMIAIANVVEIYNRIEEFSNIIQDNVIYIRLDGIASPYKYAAKYALLRRFFSSEYFVELMEELSIDALLYNASFIKEICSLYNYSYPKDYECAYDYLCEDNVKDTECNSKKYAPTLLSVWEGKWFL